MCRLQGDCWSDCKGLFSQLSEYEVKNLLILVVLKSVNTLASSQNMASLYQFMNYFHFPVSHRLLLLSIVYINMVQLCLFVDVRKMYIILCLWWFMHNSLWWFMHNNLCWFMVYTMMVLEICQFEHRFNVVVNDLIFIHMRLGISVMQLLKNLMWCGLSKTFVFFSIESCGSSVWFWILAEICFKLNFILLFP